MNIVKNRHIYYINYLNLVEQNNIINIRTLHNNYIRMNQYNYIRMNKYKKYNMILYFLIHN